LSTNEKAIAAARSFLVEANRRRQSPARTIAGELRFGVDLGTATVVITAVDASNAPVYWDFVRCGAVRDGVLVNFGEAAAAVAGLRSRAEDHLGTAVASAGTAYPPGISQTDARACRFVLEAAGVNCRVLIDEVSAAQALLRLETGAIVDVGGGSTGVGIVERGEIVALDDRPGGGHHLNLILAGALGIPVEDAEALKIAGKPEHVRMLTPGIERIASSIQRQIGRRPVDSVHLVGGAMMLPGTDSIVSEFIGLPAFAYPHSELVTPFGIAMS
jgi:ethanolamine utilization protein EutJ